MAKVADKWLQNPSGASFNSEVPTGLINGVNKEFIISETPITGTLKVDLDGLLDNSYTFDGPTKKITMITAPVIGQQIRAEYNY